MRLRPARQDDYAAIYGAGADHILGEVDGRRLAYISFRAIGSRTWGMFGMLGAATAQQKRQLFYAFRKVLHAKAEPIHVAANDGEAERLLALLGLTPTNEVYAGKKIWIWTPETSSSSAAG